MEKWDKHQRKQHYIENPSFSSSLLDVIYRSIDDVSVCEVEKPSMQKVKRVENWMEKKVKEKVVMGRNSLTELERRTRRNSNTLSMFSSSSSSESSSIGGFSSSESESFYGVQKLKAIRTSFSYEKTNFEKTQKPKHHENNGFGKTKSKALRILYGDLKKPISPGAKLASFVNSLCTSGGNAKKAKIFSSSSRTSSVHEGSKSATQAQASASSTCSSVSSFSRSCLSKTPSSTRSGGKRTVRFCPVSVIVDEDCRPCGHKNLHEVEESMKVKNKSNTNEELRFHVMQESIRVEKLARELLKNYQKKNEEDFDIMHCEEEEDDDGVSCGSSDLFELDNLSAIGIERYREELPVYETTHFNTNRAIANGFIM
ncbi:PREDICTED: protein BIG GRAIN 1-like B isoform X2 [Lupinus angustifolius]|uniref:protein BIG GRAIN 1-like B isoform X2 n=1 Tax=Lupinus angustifolius TaxID=3871 RepID=UPI00092F28E3|nr:PREDICTED: protein BIG GRAIN 1-like B isoform X2 [Lupinus angustifolius]